MKLFLKNIKWILAAIILLGVIGYNLFVHWRYSKLPENRSASTSIYSSRVQRIFWHTEFGGEPMEMRPYPFWKVLGIIPNSIRNHGQMPQSFAAAFQAGKIMISSQGLPHRTLERVTNEIFAAIWISKKWSAEETVNYLLDTVYFCHEIYGIKSAASGYYGMTPDELTNEELVFLSGLVRRPCAYSPWINRVSAENRASGVLKVISEKGLLKVGTDSKECFKRLKQRPEVIELRENSDSRNSN